MRSILVVMTLLLVAVCTSAFAESMSFREDPDPAGYQTNVQDIRSGYANNRGGVNRTIVGLDTPTMTYRGLFGFDISAIPAGAIIDSIDLTLNTVGGAGVSTSSSQVPAWNGGGYEDADFDLHALVGTMIETVGTGTTSSLGGPSWDNRDITPGAVVPWTTAGGDYVAAPLASLTVNLADILDEEAEYDLPIPLTWGGTGTSNSFVAAAQAALNGSGTLNMLLRCKTSENNGSEEGCLLFFSDDPTSTYDYSSTLYPTLTVSYTVPEPGTLVLLGGLFGVLFLRRRG